MEVCGQLSHSRSNITNVNVVVSLLTRTKRFLTHSDEFDYESTVSDLAGVKISSKEEGSGAVLEHKSIESKDKA